VDLPSSLWRQSPDGPSVETTRGCSGFPAGKKLERMSIRDDPERRWRSREGTWITWRSVIAACPLVIAALTFNRMFGFWPVLLALLALVVQVEIVRRLRRRRSTDRP
jgi:hypothetical protein